MPLFGVITLPFAPRLLQGVALLLLCGACAGTAHNVDLSANYTWKPVRLGVGGFVVGMTLHPLDPDVRYARTDVGNGYRWDKTTQTWMALRVSQTDGSGIRSPSDTAAPSVYGIDSVAVDPHDTRVVYMIFPTLHSCDVGCDNRGLVQIYRSGDGGRNFTPGGLLAAKLAGDPNGEHRYAGERLLVDPANPRVLYYGSDRQGLARSLDGGATWLVYAPASGLPATVEFLTVHFAGEDTVAQGKATRTKTLFAVSVRNGSDGGGDVYISHDGGETWQDISAGVTDSATGVRLKHQAASSSLGGAGALYVVENHETNGDERAFWRYAAGRWQRFDLRPRNGAAGIAQPLTSIVADPRSPNRIYAMGIDSSMSRSDDGGAHWVPLGPMLFANRFGWLPQTVGMLNGGWRSNGGLHFDRYGNLWAPTGQEGILTLGAAAASQATSAAPPRWTILSAGIEEQVTQDVILPRGSGDTIIVATEDTTGFVVRNPDTFTATQIPLQREIISQGTAVDTAPDVPSYIAITSSNVYQNGPNYSGYSADGGIIWTHFGAALRYRCSPIKECDVPAGMIAVSVRGTRKLGSDHIVLLPPLNFAPQYSHDGGATWHVSRSFPLQSDGMRLNTAAGALRGFESPELHQHLLRADPFTADKFYLKWTHADAPLYVSTDGGVTWTAETMANLPDNAFHGQLATNGFLKDDLWYADGWEGSTAQGVFHSSDGGKTFATVPGFSHAINIAVGKGSGQPNEASFAVYVYGQPEDGGAYGVFQSVDQGRTWRRIAHYPLGIYDRPNTLSASQDTFGKVILGWNGNSFAYSAHAP